MSTLNWLLTFEGRINRRQYFVSALVLVAIKYSIDSFVASRFGELWKATNYIFPPSGSVLFGLSRQNRSLYLTLWAIAIPFFWIGISLTLRRLRDAGHRPGWIFLFFVPIANLLMFFYLSLVPSKVHRTENADTLPNGKMPIGGTLGVVIAAVLGLALELLGANYLAQYAWGLFLGVPFITGFVTSWFLNAGGLHSRKQTIGLCAFTPILIGIFLIGFRLEGLVCLLMALPLALPFSIAGGLVAHYCLASRRVPLTPPAAAACVAIVPFLMLAERAAQLQPPVHPVVTSIVVDAPVNIVWKNVIAFPPLVAPKEWIFHTGIAYPIGATIIGLGPGAIRRCSFSTGDFVEPITIWDENHLLAFNVSSQPPSLREIGFGKITTPHIEGDYMRSRRGQFRLVALDGTHTLLEGTTWYQDNFWPQPYWRALSDTIVHRIHLRVLEHVKQQAEADVLKHNVGTP